MNPSGEVTGFGPLNAGVQSAIEEAARAAARNVVPTLSADLTNRLQTQVIPDLMRNEQLQENIGKAAGKAAFEDARPYVLVAVGALLLIASVQTFRFVGKGSSARANPTGGCECSGRKARRSRRRR